MTGSVRLQRLVLVPRGAFITGVFTGELHEPDGALIGVDSRRATTPADLVRDETGLHPQVRAFRLELMGIPVEISSFAIETTLAFPRGESASGERPPGAVPDRHLRVLPDRAAKAPSDGPVTALPDSPAPVEAALPDGLLRVLPDRPGQVQS